MQRRQVFFAVTLTLAAVVLSGCSKKPTAPVSTAMTNPGAAKASAGVTPEQLRAWIALHRARHAHRALLGQPEPGDPTPIPGGFAPGVHVFAPGPTDFGLQGLNVEPGTITDFNGFAAIGYFAGTAVGSDGVTYDMLNDMRVEKGTYVAADGSIRTGTFAFT
jgi:hypothetical protein